VRDARAATAAAGPILVGVSEQSPWGTPPPSNPYGPPQPQQPQQPSYPQQSQPPFQTGSTGGGWGGGGGPTYGSTYGGPPPQPPKRRIGLILGIVAAVVAVVAAFTVTFIVASGDDDPDSASSGDATASDSQSGSPESTETSESESPESTESTTDPTTESTTDPTTESSAPDEDFTTVTGDGYVVVLPAAGWTDQTAEASGLQGSETIDTVLVLGDSIELAQSNIIVEALDSGAAKSVEDLETLWKRNLAGTDGATTKDIADRTIGEERAIGVEINGRENAVGEPIKQIAYLMIHEGKQYSIGLSYPANGDTVSEADFEIFLASWTWLD
jgi:hypothetical protein